MKKSSSKWIFSSPQAVAVFLIILSSHLCAKAANVPTAPTSQSPLPEVQDSDVHVECTSSEMVVEIGTRSGRFTGMVYPRGLSKNTRCLAEWVQREAPVRYSLPLRGCNTMSTDLDDGGIEYFNTIVVQPHLKLVTNQGKGFHIRCRYQTRNNTILTSDSPTADSLTATTVSTPMPGCSMRIFSGDPVEKRVAENVKIGDPLSLVVAIDDQDTYGIRVTDCVVKDGLGWGEQRLINQIGCPTDPEIMGYFRYLENNTKAEVQFKAHKFPYIASVYYQCNVKLCTKIDGGCEAMTPDCSAASTDSTGNRLRRQASDVNSANSQTADPLDGGTPATIEVYSGLYVNEAADLAGRNGEEDDSVFSEKASDDAICISQRSFAIGICIAGLILMLCVVAAILFLLAKRRKKTTSHLGSSIYSGPYTNTAYSHSS